MTSAFERGWHRDARHCPSPNQDLRPASTTIDLIVVHAISLPPGQFGTGCVADLFGNALNCDTHPYFESLRTLQVSAHFFVARDGALTQFVAVERRAWHAGRSCWNGREACNDFSVGIELEGGDDIAFTDRQYLRLASLIDDIRVAYPRIAVADVVGHSDVAPGRKTDPGPCFDWPRLRGMLSA